MQGNNSVFYSHICSECMEAKNKVVSDSSLMDHRQIEQYIHLQAASRKGRCHACTDNLLSSILSLHAGTLLILLSSSTVAWFNLFIIDVQLLFLYIFCLLAILFFFIQKHNVHFLKNKSHILLRYDCFLFFFFIQFIFKEYKLIKIYNLYQRNTKEVYNN